MKQSRDMSRMLVLSATMCLGFSLVTSQAVAQEQLREYVICDSSDGSASWIRSGTCEGTKILTWPIIAFDDGSIAHPTNPRACIFGTSRCRLGDAAAFWWIGPVRPSDKDS